MMSLVLVRRFHTSGVRFGSIRTKVERLRETGSVNILTARERARIIAKKNEKIRLQKLKPYKQAKFLQKAKELGIEDPKVAKESDLSTDVALLLQKADSQMLYAYLGTSGQQLKDPHVVGNDVLKFLKKGHDTKALLLCKLAKHNGIAGMNFILQYYLEQKNYNLAFRSLVNRKKWGIFPNNQTYTILFHGFANVEGEVEKSHLAKLYEFYEGLVTGNKLKNLKNGVTLSRTHTNAAISALSNTLAENQGYAWKIFESLPLKGPHSADAATYSTLLTALKKLKHDNKEEFIKEKYELLMNNLFNRILIDSNPTYKGLKLHLDLTLLADIAGVAFLTNDEQLITDAILFVTHNARSPMYKSTGLIKERDSLTPSSHLKKILEVPGERVLLNVRILGALFPLLCKLPGANHTETLKSFIENSPKLVDNAFMYSWYGFLMKELPEDVAGDAMKEQVLGMANTFKEKTSQNPKFDLASSTVLLKYLYSSYFVQVKKMAWKGKPEEYRRLFKDILELHKNPFYSKLFDPSVDLSVYNKYLLAVSKIPTVKEEREELISQFERFLKSLDLDSYIGKGKTAMRAAMELSLVFVSMARHYNGESKALYSSGDESYHQYNAIVDSLSLSVKNLSRTIRNTKDGSEKQDESVLKDSMNTSLVYIKKAVALKNDVI